MNALHGIHIKTVLFSHIFPNHHTHLSCDNLLIGHCVKLTVYLCDIQQPVRHGSCHILSVFGNQIRDGKEGVSGHILIEAVEPVCSEYQIKGLSRRACQFHPVIKFTLRDDVQIQLQIELLFNLFVYILQNRIMVGLPVAGNAPFNGYGFTAFLPGFFGLSTFISVCFRLCFGLCRCAFI